MTDLAERRLIEAQEFTSSDEYPPVPTWTSEQMRPALVISMAEMHRREGLARSAVVSPEFARVVDAAQHVRREQDLRAAEKRQRIAQREAAEALARQGLPVPESLWPQVVDTSRRAEKTRLWYAGHIQSEMDKLLADEWTDWDAYEVLAERLLMVEEGE